MECSVKMMIEVDEVINFHGLSPDSLRLDEDDTDKLDEIIESWIKQSESLIKSYTNNNFENEVPEAVHNICLRLTSNMVNLAIQNRDTPIIKVDDWTIKNRSSNIFTADLKQDLEPFIIEKSRISDKIDFFAITG